MARQPHQPGLFLPLAPDQDALTLLANQLNKNMPQNLLQAGCEMPVWVVEGHQVGFSGELNPNEFGAFKHWLHGQSQQRNANFVFAEAPNASPGNFIRTRSCVWENKKKPVISLVPRPAPQHNLPQGPAAR